MNHFAIRPATFDDAYGIAQVRYFGWQETYRGIIQKSYLDSMSIKSGWGRWKENLSTEVPGRFVDIMTDEEGSIIAFVSGGKNRSSHFKVEGEINALYLLKQHHGKGLGRKLLVHAVGQLKNLNYKSFCLFVLKENPAAAFYRKFNPDLEECQVIKIGKAEYDDIGLGWSDIEKFQK